MTWNLTVAELDETCQSTMRSHAAGDIVWLPNDTLQICAVHAGSPLVYEVYIEDYNVNWLFHISEKPWATRDLLFALADAARRVLMMTHRAHSVYARQFSPDALNYALEHLENVGC